MSLSTALNIAQSSLFNTSRQTSVLSRNVQESGNSDYSRRSAILASTTAGSQVVEVRRAADDRLLRQNLSAISAWNGQDSVSSGLESLSTSVNGVDGASSPATALTALQEALQTYSATPSNDSLGDDVVSSARDIVTGLKSASDAVQAFRTDTDGEIATAVSELNSLLADFKKANDAVVAGTKSGRDVNDALDQRDAILKKIAGYVPVTTTTRDGNDMMIYSNGATLFEGTPREVGFEASSSLAAGTVGNPITVDGVPLPVGTGGKTDASGKLSGLLQLRDKVAMTMQSQLDEVARGLISSFAEKSQSGGDDAAGLFTWTGGPAIPADGTLVSGLASQLKINAAFDPNQGGDPTLLRDGGANGSDYIANTTGAASYSTLLNSYSDKIDESRAFDSNAGISTKTSLQSFASASVGWLDGLRKSASTASETNEALVTRTTEALSNATGVNVDDEMSKLLELEHSYEASSRMIKAVDEMLSTLMAAVG